MRLAGLRAIPPSLAVVFRRGRYIALAVGVALVLLTLTIWLPNLHLLRFTLTSDALDLSQRTSIFLSSFQNLRTNFTPLTRVLTLMIVVLSGVNVALVTFYLRRRVAADRAAGASLFGTVVGLLGVGCASCGSVILSSLFGVSATAGFLGVFPLRGAEFGLLGIALLAVSITLVSGKIQNPLACNLKT